MLLYQNLVAVNHHYDKTQLLHTDMKDDTTKKTSSYQFMCDYPEIDFLRQVPIE